MNHDFILKLLKSAGLFPIYRGVQTEQLWWSSGWKTSCGLNGTKSRLFSLKIQDDSAIVFMPYTLYDHISYIHTYIHTYIHIYIYLIIYIEHAVCGWQECSESIIR